MDVYRKKSSGTILLLLLILFLPVNYSLSQNLEEIAVSIRAVNKPLHSVLDDLTNQCGYFFTFDSRLVNSQQRISMNIKEISVKAAIDTLFRDPGLSYEIINRNIVIFPEYRRVAAAADDSSRATAKTLKVNGNISDMKSGKPLEYATVAVLDTYYGTISNEDGDFTLHLPDSLQRPVLVTSFIGYKNHYTPISIHSDEKVRIRMNRQLISIQEVIIRYQNPESILLTALKSIPKNYLNVPSGMIAYYREKVNKDEKTMIFSEAVVEIAKASYTENVFNERSRILKGRQITDIEIQDTVVFKIRSGLNAMLELDIIKSLPDFLSYDFASIYNLQFSDVVAYKDKLVYVISFSQKETIDETLFRGDLYIDRETLAIVAADFEYDPDRLGRETDMFVAKKSRNVKIRPVSARYHVEYKESGNYYHLAHVQGDVIFRVRKRGQWIGSKYHINLEMAVTNVDPDNPPRIRFSEQIRSNSILSEEIFAYDADFWGVYNTITPEASLTEALQNIKKSLLEINSAN
jgi:hypothetical protein